MRWILILLLLGTPWMATGDDDVKGIDALPEAGLADLSEQVTGALGKAALGVRAAEWKHAETPHFILHFFHNFVAAQVSVELEYYYKAISTELHRNTAGWERKSHVFIFESDADWGAFRTRAQLDPWTGGIHAAGNLFILRNPKYKFEGRSLGHETAHLVLYRFFGPGTPLWLNEGYAENSSIRFYAGLERRRGYAAAPRSPALAASDYIKVAELTGAASYPDDVTKVPIFYHESEKLVGFLREQGGEGFIDFLDALSHGSRLDTALEKGFGGRFRGIDALEREFQPFAAQAYRPLAGS